MRLLGIATLLVVLCSPFGMAAAKPDTGLSAAFETYLTNRLHTEAAKLRRDLYEDEHCGVLYRAVEEFRKEVKRGSGRDLEKHLTYASLVHLRMIERECDRHKRVFPVRDKNDEGPGDGIDDPVSNAIYNLEDDVDDSLEAEALRDFIKWHPDEFEAKNPEEAADYAVLKWEVSKRARELKAQLEEAKYEAGGARLQVQFGINRKAPASEIQALEAAAQEAEKKVKDLESQIRSECVLARDAAVSKWVRDNVPVGTAEDMRPKTTSGQTRSYTDAEGNNVTEYDNGARSISYPDGREVTVEPDGTRITEHPDGHVVRENPDGSIECLKDHPDGVLRIVVQPNGETDYYLNGDLVAHYWPDWFPDRLVRHQDFIDPETGLTPIERLSPMQKFRLWLRKKRAEEDHVVDWKDREAVAQYYLDQLAEFKRTHPGVFDDETFEEFVVRREFELRHAQRLERGRKPTAEDRRENYRIILTEWEKEHPDETLSLAELIAKRKLEEALRNGVIKVKEIPLSVDAERLKLEIQAYLDWLKWHPNPTQDEERERRQHAARLRLALKAQRALFEGTADAVGGEEALRKLVGEKRYRAMKAAYETLPTDLPDKAAGGSVDPLDPRWPGPKPAVARATFTSLNGVTRVNGALLDDETITLTIVGVDGEERTPSPQEARTQPSGDDVFVSVSPTLQLSGVILRSNEGMVILRSAPQAAAMQGAVAPLDGIIDIRNGQLRETLKVPDSLTDIDAPVEAHGVRLGQGLTPASNPSAGVVAVKEGEVAIYAENAKAPTQGTAECSIEGPDGQSAIATLPAWSYHFQPQPVTAVNVWAPIFFMVAGLPPEEQLRITLSPPAGVTTDPKKTKVRAGEYSALNQLARYRTSIVGPQPIGVRVERLE